MTKPNPPADTRTIEELQRDKTMLEIEKLRTDLARSDKMFRMELAKLMLGAFATGAAVIGAIVALTR